MNERKAKIIALAGKGGVGKTSLAATIVRVLTEDRPGCRVLAIDADPAVGRYTPCGNQKRRGRQAARSDRDAQRVALPHL